MGYKVGLGLKTDRHINQQSQPPSEKLPPAGDGNKYRDPEPESVLRARDLGTPLSKCDDFHKSLPSGLRELCGSGGRKSVKARNG